MKFSFAFILPGLPPLNRQHKHWAVLSKQNKEWRSMAAVATIAAMPDGVRGNVSKVAVKYTRRSSVECDTDNLHASTKAIQDGICDTLGCDDRPSTLTPLWAWEHAQPKRGEVKIQIQGATK